MPEDGAALLELLAVSRVYPAGDAGFAALKNVNLTIRAGEFVAIVGPSGSGKSTLMNILGCLDCPTAGTYRVAGTDISLMSPDELSRLRCKHFGFIFQRYNLLPDLSALGNVEVPAVYAGAGRLARHAGAAQLLSSLGLAERLQHRPAQLSGGQQQRVSIARALMNGGEVILADEPTGALDSHSGEEVLRILKDLNEAGHTIVLITHDQKVARHAARVVAIADGEVTADDARAAPQSDGSRVVSSVTTPRSDGRSDLRRALAGGRLLEALRMALLAMRAHRLRTFLTMLGIIIGIASLSSVVALGEGGRRRVLSDIRSIGTRTIDVYPGGDWGDERASAVQTLTPGDAQAILEQGYVDSVTPVVSARATVRYGAVSAVGSISGVGESYFRVHGLELSRGLTFGAGDVSQLSQVVVIDEHTERRFFADQDPLGKVILLGRVPCRIIGVTKARDYEGGEQTLHLYSPYTTVMGRLLGQSRIREITTRIAEGAPTSVAETAIRKLLMRRHGRKDFFIENTDTVIRAYESSVRTLSLLISSIAAISLVVGGIGVMNIMLVSVTERTREIGVRMAIGARRGDILRQFLIEATLVCLAGAAIGVLLSLAVGLVFSHFVHEFPMVFSKKAMLAAVVVSTLIGLLFGYLPARNAARLDPIDALARE